eukprot:CAMPEP_0171476870 /NCGR_PEP_ID=MMETSP0946-20130122/3850_1 /TAXON_ID=109269 /ORGANISM="Vaucheria litorea, Strain CCMP2940" /LENGTH=99 /DNA_ID=CAMNT_0012007219 /DNA_START=84 /DNA_END=379 /DNA_ORIENTATION=-
MTLFSGQVGEGSTESITQGKVPVEQGLYTALVQQATAPPGRESQPNPPQEPHDSGQQFSSYASGMLPLGHPVGASVGGSVTITGTHGRAPVEHNAVTEP